MSKTISIHSFRHGVGRSNITASLAYLLAAEGYQTAILDTDSVAPSLHHLLHLNDADFTYSLAHYLDKKCSINQVAHNVSNTLQLNLRGQIYYICANTAQEQAAQQTQGVQYAEWLYNGCRQIISALKLDALLLDTQPGLEQETLIPLTVSDAVVIVMRHDQRDYQGTSVAVDIVRRLNIPDVLLIVNEAPRSFTVEDIKVQIEKTYHYKVGAVLPYLEEIVTLANKDIFALHYPQHFATLLLKQVALQLIR